MSTFGNVNKCQRQSTSHLSPRAGTNNAHNSPFASSPSSSTSSQSVSPPRKRDALRSAAAGFVNVVRQTAARSKTAVPEFKGVRYREELNKYVTEIRPTRCQKKIWLGTYETAEEAGRAYDIGNLCCNKKIPLNFADSPQMIERLPRIAQNLSPDDSRNAIANLAKECARLHKIEAANPPAGNSYLCASSGLIATPQAPFAFQAAMAESGLYGNQFDAHSDSISFVQVQQFDVRSDPISFVQVQPQQLQLDARMHNCGTRSDTFFEQQPPEQVATAMTMTRRGDGSRSWEFDVDRSFPSNKSLPETDLPVLTEAPLDAIDDHMYEDNVYPDQLLIDSHIFSKIFGL